VELADLPDTGTLVLGTLGRRSGETRTVEIWFVRADGAVHVVGTPGPRHWLANIRACPDVSLGWDGHDLPASATEVTDPARRAAVVRDAWRLQPWYAAQPFTMADWVASAPVVRLEPRG
jgi:deazaflavin-dependent oxidoreductase (nitroreductase family)